MLAVIMQHIGGSDACCSHEAYYFGGSDSCCNNEAHWGVQMLVVIIKHIGGSGNRYL